MKFIFNLVIVLLISSLSMSAYSANSIGKIKTIKVCGSGDTTNNNRWNSYFLFKMDDDVWYFTYANYISYNIHNRDLDDNITISVVLLAYANQYEINVSSNRSFNRCGVDAYVIWNLPDEYIEITQPTQ